jgi:hypothetical protein
MMESKSTHELLYILSQKGHCSYNKYKCYSIMNVLSDRLEKDEKFKLRVGLSHMFYCFEGPDELIDICKDLMKKYKDD